MTAPEERPENRPKNREVEDEMVCPPDSERKPPRPATEPKQGGREQN